MGREIWIGMKRSKELDICFKIIIMNFQTKQNQVGIELELYFTYKWMVLIKKIT